MPPSRPRPPFDSDSSTFFTASATPTPTTEVGMDHSSIPPSLTAFPHRSLSSGNASNASGLSAATVVNSPRQSTSEPRSVGMAIQNSNGGLDGSVPQDPSKLSAGGAEKHRLDSGSSSATMTEKIEPLSGTMDEKLNIKMESESTPTVLDEQVESSVARTPHLVYNEKKGIIETIPQDQPLGDAKEDDPIAAAQTPSTSFWRSSILPTTRNSISQSKKSKAKPVERKPSITESARQRRKKAASENQNKSARFSDKVGSVRGKPLQSIKSAWEVVKETVKNPSHPSTTSDSAQGGETDTTGNSVQRSLGGTTYPKPSRPNALTRRPYALGRRATSGAATNSSAGGHRGGSSLIGDEELEKPGPAEPVSHVVVESDLGNILPPVKSDNGAAATPGDHGGFAANATEAEAGAGPRGDGATGQHRNGNGSDGHPSWAQRLAQGVGSRKTDASSIRRERRDSVIRRSWLYEFVVERYWPALWHFFDSAFVEPKKEGSYQKESWFVLRRGAIATSGFFVIAWILTTALLPKPYSILDEIGYIGVTGFFILPLPFFTVLDTGRRRPLLWQTWLWCAIWGYSFVVLVDMHNCAFYSDYRHCGQKDFLGLLYWGTALPTLGSLTMGQKRFPHLLGVLVWVILVCTLIFTQGAPQLMYRNMVNFILFHFFLVIISYFREKSDRQMFALRVQLKLQYRATQAAQVAERKASDSKKRFVSYIFHEVRVPLNTALLAVQNLQGEAFFDNCADEQQREMVDGLMGSLTMMEKVLNDVLSFNRMESGKFKQARKPFEFHKSVQLVVLSHRSQAMASDLTLTAELDPEIDRIGGIFVGDEMRIRQVMSNFVSNAIKFTPSGSVKIVTKLLYPRLESASLETTPVDERPSAIEDLQADQAGPLPLSSESLAKVPSEDRRTRSAVSAFVGMPPRPVIDNKAIIRVEVHDTGVGLNRKDVVDSRLFSAYVQTEIGRRQGGKGSGLGLALCLQIIKSLKGRLGVESKQGEGSQFWFELALTLPPPTSQRHVELSIPPPLPRTISDRARLPRVDAHDFATTAQVSPPPPTTDSQRPLLEETPSPMSVEMTSPMLGLSGSSTQAENVLDRIDQQVQHEMQEELGHPIAIPMPPELKEVVRAAETPSALTHRKDLEAPALAQPQVMAMKPAAPQMVMVEPSRPAVPVPIKPELPEKMHCLVVDDDKLTRMLMTRMIQRIGHKVSTAENGAVALKLLRERHLNPEQKGQQYDIVFLDNQMPLMSGVELSRELRRIACPIYIAGCTGNALKEDRDEYLEAGSDEVLTKPIKEADVRRMLEEAKLRNAGLTQPRAVDTILDEPEDM